MSFLQSLYFFFFFLSWMSVGQLHKRPLFLPELCVFPPSPPPNLQILFISTTFTPFHSIGLSSGSVGRLHTSKHLDHCWGAVSLIMGIKQVLSLAEGEELLLHYIEWTQQPPASVEQWFVVPGCEVVSWKLGDAGGGTKTLTLQRYGSLLLKDEHWTKLDC